MRIRKIVDLLKGIGVAAKTTTLRKRRKCGSLLPLLWWRKRNCGYEEGTATTKLCTHKHYL